MSLTHPKFKVAAVQATPVYMDLKGTVDKTIALIEEAAKNGAKLIGFPETWIPGYPYWSWLDSQAWAFQWVQRYFDNSLVIGSEEDMRIRQAAKDNDILWSWDTVSATLARCTLRRCSSTTLAS